MSDKNTILSSILDTLDSEESAMIEKTATDANALKNTENPEAKKKVPTESPTKKEGPLGLSVLSKNKHEDTIRRYDGVEANKPDHKGTEDITVKKTPVEPGVMFEKKASDETIQAIYEAAGIDLQKVASEGAEEEVLLKVAEDTMNELKDLEKIAEQLAEVTADKFMKIISDKI